MYLIYDTETTGKNPEQAKIASIAAILVTPDNREVMSLNAIVYRDEPIPDEAAAIHGITTEISQSLGLNEGTVLTLFEEMLNLATATIGHNEGYDRKVVSQAIRCLDGQPGAEPFAGKKSVDTMKLATPLCKIPSPRGGFKWPTLTEAHTKLLGEGFDGAHGAMADVQACRRLFFKIQEMARGAQAA